MSLSKEDRVHLHKVINHLDEGGEVEYSVNDLSPPRRLKSKDIHDDCGLCYAFLNNPCSFTIIERPMVHVYKIASGKRCAVTTDELDGEDVEEWIKRRNALDVHVHTKLIQSFPIDEEQT